MRLAVIAALVSGLVPGMAAAENLKFYEKPISTMAECHALLALQAPDWKTSPDVIVRKLSNGAELIDHCMADGVAEFYCNPKGKQALVGVLIDQTVAVCKKMAPKLKVRKGDMLFDR